VVFLVPQVQVTLTSGAPRRSLRNGLSGG
jgi:hypothetical protein